MQCASLLGYFNEVLQIYGPFLVVVPLSTVPNWIREFRKWIPNLNAVVYVGDTKSREVIREFEFVNRRRSDREFKFEALITTYELVLKDSDILSQIRWNFLVVDEAHRFAASNCATHAPIRPCFCPYPCCDLPFACAWTSSVACSVPCMKVLQLLAGLDVHARMLV